jgi:uncharacterized protein (DUF1778 family)
MATVSVQFTDEEMVVLRAAADREGKPLSVFAHDAAMSEASPGKRSVEQVSTRVAEISRQLNERLA